MFIVIYIIRSFYIGIILANGTAAETYDSKMIIDMASAHSGQIITVVSNTSNIISAINIAVGFPSVLFQVHSQIDNITLSYTNAPSFDNAITGKNVGLMCMMQGNASTAMVWLINSTPRNISVFLKLILLKDSDPIPGGCNMEFSIEIAPYLRLIDDQFSTRLVYQHANLGYSRNKSPSSCSRTLDDFRYDIFVYYLKENSFEEKGYFSGIEGMTNLSFIHTHAIKVPTRTAHPHTRVIFFKYPQTGVIYNVVARLVEGPIIAEIPYVPISTYGCKFEDGHISSCWPYNIMTVPVLVILSAFGLFIAFFGHKYFETELLFFGTSTFMFLTFILLSKYTSVVSSTGILIYSVFVGIGGGLICVLTWALFYRPVISVIPTGLNLTFLVVAVVLYTPVGNNEAFITNTFYWPLVTCFCLAVTICLLTLPKLLSIVGSSVVGSYAAILIVSYYSGSSQLFIVVNMLKRAIEDNWIIVALNSAPFQKSDIAVCVTWVILSVLALIFQTYTSRNFYFLKPRCSCIKLKYPICTCIQRPQNDTEDAVVSETESIEELENRPLLSDSINTHGYDTI